MPSCVILCQFEDASVTDVWHVFRLQFLALSHSEQNSFGNFILLKPPKNMPSVTAPLTFVRPPENFLGRRSPPKLLVEESRLPAPSRWDWPAFLRAHPSHLAARLLLKKVVPCASHSCQQVMQRNLHLALIPIHFEGTTSTLTLL